MSVFYGNAALKDSCITSTTIQNSILNNVNITANSLYVSDSNFYIGGITTGSIFVTGPSILNGYVTIGSINVTGDSIIEGCLTVTCLNVIQEAIFESGITANSSLFTTISTGGLVVTGGTSLQGDIVFNGVNANPNLGDILEETCVTLANNQNIPVDILGFNFQDTLVRSFKAETSISIRTSGGTNDKYAEYTLTGIQRNGDWCLNKRYVGDRTGIKFTITSTGQIQYTSSNISGFIENKFCFRATTTNK